MVSSFAMPESKLNDFQIEKAFSQLKDQKKQDEDFLKCLEEFEKLRYWQFNNNINAWAFRQAIIYFFQVDSMLAQRSGKSKMELDKFDLQATRDAILTIQRQLANDIPLFGRKP